jgi:hypothetical protein
MAVDNAKLETAVGSCGLGSCRSSCCEEEEGPENGCFPPQDAAHKEMEVANRVELALVHKMVTDEMIAGLKHGTPRLDVARETDDAGTRIVITIRPPKKEGN